MKYRWSEGWKGWVPDGRAVIDSIPPLERGPLELEHRCNSIDCIPCWNAGVRYADYRKDKKANTL